MKRMNMRMTINVNMTICSSCPEQKEQSCENTTGPPVCFLTFLWTCLSNNCEDFWKLTVLYLPNALSLSRLAS